MKNRHTVFRLFFSDLFEQEAKTSTKSLSTAFIHLFDIILQLCGALGRSILHGICHCLCSRSVGKDLRKLHCDSEKGMS